MGKTLGTPTHKVFRDLLVKMREEIGLSQVEVARRLGRHQSFVSKYETGERPLDVADLKTVAAALGVSLLAIVRRFEKGLGKNSR